MGALTQPTFICPKLMWMLLKFSYKTPERRKSRRFGVFTVHYEQIAHIVLLFPLLSLKK